MLADSYDCQELKMHADDFIKRNFTQVSQNDEFVNLDCKQLIHFVSCNDIVVTIEETVYEAVIKWVRHDTEKRIPQLSSILTH